MKNVYAVLMTVIFLSACGPEITLHPASATNLAVVDGDAQMASVGQFVAHAPTVRIVDAVGAPVRGVNVTFTVTRGGGSLGLGTTETRVSDSDGRATVSGWAMGPTLGPNSLVAVTDGGLSVAFGATAVLGAPSVLFHSGGGEGATFLALPVNLPNPAVQVKDEFGNNLPGIPIVWSLKDAPLPNVNCSPSRVVTDSLGIAVCKGASVRAFEPNGYIELTATVEGTSVFTIFFWALHPKS